MTSPELAVQTAIRLQLTGSGAVTALVPADHILDRHARPVPDPSIIIGEDVSEDTGRLDRDAIRVVSTLHVWKKEPSLAGVKTIVGAVRSALRSGLAPQDGYQFAGCHVSATSFLRDPDGETSHAVVAVETLAASP